MASSRALHHVAGPWRYVPGEDRLDATTGAKHLVADFPDLSESEAFSFVSQLRPHAETALQALVRRNPKIILFREEVDIFLGLTPGHPKRLTGAQSDAPIQVMLPLILLDTLLAVARPSPPAVPTPRTTDRPSLGLKPLNEVYKLRRLPTGQLTRWTDDIPPASRLAQAPHVSRVGKPGVSASRAANLSSNTR